MVPVDILDIYNLGLLTGRRESRGPTRLQKTINAWLLFVYFDLGAHELDPGAHECVDAAIVVEHWQCIETATVLEPECTTYLQILFDHISVLLHVENNEFFRITNDCVCSKSIVFTCRHSAFMNIRKPMINCRECLLHLCVEGYL